MNTSDIFTTTDKGPISDVSTYSFHSLTESGLTINTHTYTVDECDGEAYVWYSDEHEAISKEKHFTEPIDAHLYALGKIHALKKELANK